MEEGKRGEEKIREDCANYAVKHSPTNSVF